MTFDLGARWTARQLAMLQAMGIDFGARPRDDRDPVDAEAPAAAPRPPRASSEPARPSPVPDRLARSRGDTATATTLPPPQVDLADGDAAPAPAHWLVVSEPLPAGSPAAKLLGSMLRAVGLMPVPTAGPPIPPTRRAALAPFEPGADPAADRARLLEAVRRAAPRCIVVLGRAPARVLLSTELPLADLRGTVHRLGETPVVVSYAVPYLLRQPVDKARAWDDLCLATRACEKTG